MSQASWPSTGFLPVCSPSAEGNIKDLDDLLDYSTSGSLYYLLCLFACFCNLENVLIFKLYEN